MYYNTAVYVPRYKNKAFLIIYCVKNSALSKFISNFWTSCKISFISNHFYFFFNKYKNICQYMWQNRQHHWVATESISSHNYFWPQNPFWFWACRCHGRVCKITAHGENPFLRKFRVCDLISVRIRLFNWTHITSQLSMLFMNAQPMTTHTCNLILCFVFFWSTDFTYTYFLHVYFM